jgi:Ran GTPase-activating protein (RanGAP) involved in mRNA processing and transport
MSGIARQFVDSTPQKKPALELKEMPLQRLVPSTEDDVRAVSALVQPAGVSALESTPAVVCSDTETACAAFWDCADLVWVTTRWAGALEVKGVPVTAELLGGALFARRVESLEVDWRPALGAALGPLERLRRLSVRFGGPRSDVRDFFAALGRAGTCVALEELDLNYSDLSEGGLEALCGALGRAEGWAHLRAVRLFRSELGDAGLAALGARLAGLPRLQTLDVSRSALTAASGRRLGAWFGGEGSALGRGFEQLTALDVSGNALGAEGARGVLEGAACARSLRRLSLAATGLGDAGAGALAEALAVPGALGQLRELDLSSNGVGAAGAAALGSALPRCARLAVLSLASNTLGREGGEGLAAGLGGCAALEDVDLSWCDVGAEGMRAVAAALRRREPSLRALRLRGNRMGDEGAAHVAETLATGRWPNLRRLLLCMNEIAADGAEAIAAALARAEAFPSLREVELAINAIRLPGAQALASLLVHSPRACPALISLDVRINSVPPHDAERLPGIAARVALPAPRHAADLRVLLSRDEHLGSARDKALRALLIDA